MHDSGKIQSLGKKFTRDPTEPLGERWENIDSLTQEFNVSGILQLIDIKASF